MGRGDDVMAITSNVPSLPSHLFRQLRASRPSVLALLLGVAVVTSRAARAKKAIVAPGGWALVTGATSGIGKAVCQRLAELGVPIVLVARNAAKLDRVQHELGTQTETIAVDLAVDGSIGELLGHLKRLGLETKIDALVLNAGVAVQGAFAASEWSRTRAMILLNVVNTVQLAREVLPSMVERRRGIVTIVSSVAGSFPSPNESVYSATKAFLDHFAAAVRYELSGSGVDVLLVKPGATLTQFGSASGSAHVLAFRLPRLPWQLGFGPMLPTEVADDIVAGMQRRSHTVVSGVGNQLGCIAAKLIPSSLAVHVAACLWT